FGTVETAADASRPQVTITSNYNPESVLYYDPGSGDMRTSASHLPPDIILNTGKTIDDLTGAVNITSAAGNIYIHGAINAGSVNILAKNGDFVSSYVNGFDPIGGDPASFNNPTNAAEAGTGITANGAISIAARYLNINSTIQSGIADWTLNLDGSPTLTTNDETSIGLAGGTEAAALGKFKQDVAAATSAADMPSLQIALGTGITLDMAPEGIDATDLATKIGDYIAAYNTAVASKSPLPTPVVSVDTTAGGTTTVNIKDFLSPQVTGRIEFSKATADAYAAANSSATATYGVVSPTSTIGAAYDAQNKQFVVDGTSVHGGSIQLYGQIMNTASSGGQLNVLDGFGTINITNTSNIPVVLSTLSTGDDPSGNGRGTAGVIDITDVTGVDATIASLPVVSVKHTIYTRDYVPGGTGQVQKQVQYGLIDPLTGQIVDEIADAGKTHVYDIDTTTWLVSPGSASDVQHVLDISKVAAVSSGDDRSTTYDTTAGQRYVWTTGDYYEVLTYFQNSGTELSGTNWEFTSVTDLTATNGPNLTAHLRLDDGTYVSMANDYTATASDQVNLNGTSGVVIVAANQAATSEQNSSTDLEGKELVTASQTFVTLNDLHDDGSSSDCNWWTLCIASDYTYYYHLDQKYTTVTTNSLKADHPIDINFIGSDTGAIDVNSSSNVVLTNNVTARNGTVTIKATGTDVSGKASSIIEGNLAASVNAHSADLEAAGSVGDLTWSADPAAPTAAAVAVNLSGGPLTATAANGNVFITSGSDLDVKQVTAAGYRSAGLGEVNLFTSKSIAAADSSSYIEAPRVTLTALNGSVGGTGDSELLKVNTGYVAGDTTRVFGDPATDPTLATNPLLGLSVTAAGDIGITSDTWSGNSDGTMLVDQVLSLGGDVRLVSTGQILDNNPVQSVDQRTYAQLLNYWNTLGLVDDPTKTNDPNDLKKAAAVTAYENSKTQQYDEYWAMRQQQADGGATYDPNFVYTPSAQQTAALSSQFTAQEQAAHPGFTNQQITDAVTADIASYASGQTTLYHQLNAEVGSLTQSFDTKNPYTYKASSTEIAALTNGASWTTRELAFSLSPGALKTVTGTNPVLKDPNVSGRTVTIEAQKGVGETVGAGTANVGVSIRADLDPSALTMDQKVALAAAERSDLELDVIMPGTTVPVKVPLGTDYADLTSEQQAALDAAAANPTTHAIDDSKITIVVLSKRPLNFSASTGLNVTVADNPNGTLDIGDAYLASRDKGALANISVPGETRIKVSGNITNATGGSSISTGNLILEASQGGIGTSIKPVNLGLGSGATFIGRAQNGVYVDFTGDAAIDTVYSPQDVSLQATGALLGANKDQLINVLGTDVTLSAASIGSLTQALNVGNNLGGGITASADGLINLYGPANNLFDIKSVTSTTGDITLTAGFEGIIDGPVKAPGGVTLDAGGRFVISGVGDVESTAGDVSVLGNSLKMINGATIT